MRKTLWALVIALSAGCTSVSLNKDYKGPMPLPLEYDLLTAPRKPEAISFVLLEEQQNYSVYSLTIDGSKSIFYLPRKSRHEKSPVIFITPGMVVVR